MPTHPLRFAAFAVALLAISTALSAQGPGPGPSFGPGHGPAGEGRRLNGLNLTEAQQTQVKAIHDNHLAAFKAKGQAADAARKAMHDGMANAATDAKTLKALHETVSAAQFDLMLEHRAVRQEILPLLTADQKAQWGKHPMGMGRHGGRGKGSGMGPDSPPVQPS